MQIETSQGQEGSHMGSGKGVLGDVQVIWEQVT